MSFTAHTRGHILFDLLCVSAACRESFRVLTFRTSFMTQPPGRYTYCQSKARYSWIIFRKISPYNLLRRPVYYRKLMCQVVHFIGQWSWAAFSCWLTEIITIQRLSGCQGHQETGPGCPVGPSFVGPVRRFKNFQHVQRNWIGNDKRVYSIIDSLITTAKDPVLLYPALGASATSIFVLWCHGNAIGVFWLHNSLLLAIYHDVKENRICFTPKPFSVTHLVKETQCYCYWKK